MNNSPSTENVILVTPVFNDWAAFGLLVEALDEALSGAGMRLGIVAVDDGSTTPVPSNLFKNRDFKAVTSVEVLELRRNLGHQRAIVTALSYVEENLKAATVMVMDADGEDQPADVPRLFERYLQEGGQKLVFARRERRSEGLAFRFFYVAYRGFFRVLTGSHIRFGNFSIMPRRILERLVAVSELWNHYSSGVLKSRVPYVEIATQRGKRLTGSSQMSFISLVVHGLSSLSVYGDTIGVRALVAMSVFFVLSVGGLAAVILIRVVTSLAIPGWASYLTGLFLIILMQILTMLLFFVFMILNNRTTMSFLPKRDYCHFVLRITKLR